MANTNKSLKEIDTKLEALPKGTLTYKTINGSKQPYLQRTVDGKSVCIYIKKRDRERILLELEERRNLQLERERILAYAKNLQKILQKNPYMDRDMSLGYQNFSDLMKIGGFYVDKTAFIADWWENNDFVTLITRPRRFGKTLIMSTVDCYFSPDSKDCHHYFKPLSIWKHVKMRELCGSVPVIFLSFGGVKGTSFAEAMAGIVSELRDCLRRYRKMGDPTINELFHRFDAFLLNNEEYAIDSLAAVAIRILSECLKDYYDTKPLILLDEYDTPLTEAAIAGYWNEMIGFYRHFINETFKRNSHYQRGLITGVTKVSKNSLFSDMNHIRSYSVTDSEYAEYFGFTEQEVMDALQCYELQEMEQVKAMYDGFVIGNRHDIYNPWSICCFMKNREMLPYWVNTASNSIIADLIRRNSMGLKQDMEILLQGGTVRKIINEEIAYQFMDGDEDSFWSLLLSVGYIKPVSIHKRPDGTECELMITNQESRIMFQMQILRMFQTSQGKYGKFVEALLNHDVEMMKYQLDDLMYSSVSYFDTGHLPSSRIPENFYHGMVLGLIVVLRDKYVVTSNRESGVGRYDISIVPRDPSSGKASIILEFKVRNPKTEKDLEETARKAFQQIEEKKYEIGLIEQGVEADRIYKIGFGFEGKEVEVFTL